MRYNTSDRLVSLAILRQIVLLPSDAGHASDFHCVVNLTATKMNKFKD